MLLIQLIFYCIFQSPPVFSQDLSSVEILSATELKNKIDEFLVIDAREKGFADGHLPKSQPMQWQDWTEEKPSFLNNFFGDPSKWGKVSTEPSVQKRLQAFGLKKNQNVLVIGQGGGWGEEGRIAWNMLFWGVKKVVLLDGGYPAWQSAGLPIEKGKAQSLIAGDFTIALNNQRRAQKKDISQNLLSHNHEFLDARTEEEFAGKKMPGQKHGGKIPGAKLVPFSKLYTSDGHYISALELKKLIGPQETAPITYCTGGVRSALLALLIEARLGIKALSYDASMWEWSRN